MTPLSPRPGPEARELAGAMSRDLERATDKPLTFRGIDLRPALEQVLFTTLRAGIPSRPGRRARIVTALRRPALIADAVRRRDPLEQADVLVMLLAGVHRTLFAPIAAELERSHPQIVVRFVAVGRAARDPRLADLPTASGQVTLRDAGAVFAQRAGRQAIAAATTSWAASFGEASAKTLRSLARDTVVRLTVEAVRLDAAVRQATPKVVVTYDEIDAWGRLVVEVARCRGVRSLDLPHAEAVDADAIRGLAYDRIGVFGPRAAEVLRSAGVPADRIAVVGPARFDPLIHAARSTHDVPPRVVLAAQYRAGRMTDAVRGGVLAAALAAAEAIGGVLQLRPHPVEPPAAWDVLLANAPSHPAVEVRVEHATGLHELLPGAALLVTGWSNSVYEAVLAGVPALTVNLLDGDTPMPFAAERIAAEVRTPDEAARLARSLLDESVRTAALEVARRGLAAHLGPLDGAAAERTAAMVEEMAREYD